MERKSAETLPKTGAVCAQWVRCGKPTCRCAGGALHGPYYARFARVDGMLRKRYVKLAAADRARAEADAARDLARTDRAARAEARRRWGALAALVREAERGRGGHD